MSLLPFGSRSKHDLVLGLHVTKAEVRAALVKRHNQGYRFIDRFHRYRSQAVDQSQSDRPGAGGLPGEGGGELSDTDYTLEFEGGGSHPGGSAETEAADEEERFPFPAEIEDIISDCRRRHGSDFEIALTSTVGGVEITHFTSTTDEGADEPSSADLLDLLNGVRSETVHEDQVVFHRLGGQDGTRQKYLAIIRSQDDPVVETIRQVKKRHQVELPPVLGIQVEISVLLDPEIRPVWETEEGTTTLVRVGPEDTAVTFLRNGQLVDQERLPSVSVHEAPDKVCKRVLLCQDEAGIDDPDRIVVLAEGQEEGFKVHFSNLYPDAEIVSLYGLITEHLGEGPNKDDQPAGLFGLAALTAWQVLAADQLRAENNLLSESLQGREKIRFAWHTGVALLLLFGVTAALVFRYQQQQARITQLQSQVNRYPAAARLSTDQIQTRVDSLETLYQQYTQGLQDLDSLLVNSDQWSRMMARVVDVRQQVPGVWIRSWSPSGPNRVQIEGFATRRNRVVEVANQLEARLKNIETAEIRGFPVFRFSMDAPLPTGLPQATIYLREHDSLASDTSLTYLKQ